MSKPNISITSATQTSAGSKSLSFRYTLSSIETGAVQEFYVASSNHSFSHMSEYDSSVSDGSFSKTIDLTNYWNGFGSYTIRLWVYNSSNSEDQGYKETTVSMVDNRPNDFTFPNSITSGAPTTVLTASTWRNFCNRINEFRTYKSMSEYDFTYVSSGDQMTREIMEEPWIAINAISGHGTMPTRPTRGAIIYASFFHDLARALNAIN